MADPDPARDGARAIAPLAIAAFPIGLVYGVTVADADVENWIGGVASSVIVAAAAQLALIDLIADGAGWVTAVGTALVINLRFVMYSAALAPSFREHPAGWRVPMAYLMTDQVAAVSLIHDETERDPSRRRWFYIGAGILFVGAWVVGTWVGILFGASIPESWELGFAVPLMFLALLVPSIRDRSGLVAAGVAAVVSLVARDAPNGTGLLIAAFAGVVVALAVDAR